jgi:hypothetical protein
MSERGKKLRDQKLKNVLPRAWHDRFMSRGELPPGRARTESGSRFLKRPFPLILGVFTVLGVPIFALVCFLWIGIPTETKGPLTAAVTFSIPQAESLELDWREVLAASLDDLGIRRYRIPAYWSRLEEHRGTYEWAEMDFQMDEIAKRNGKVLLSIGLKTPRWPECWWPDWAKNLPAAEEHAAQLAYMSAVVNRYREHPALEAWQIENEPTFHFGICPKPDLAFFKKEIEHVHALNGKHPIVTTDSGELSTWIPAGSLVETLGVSVYRVVRVPWGWVWSYDWIPPYWYARRAALVSPWVKNIFVSEFQMEPWFERHPLDTPLSEQIETFDINRMQKNFRFSEQMHINTIYFWGVEWWYWMKTHHSDDRFWNEAKGFFQKHRAI